MPLRKDKKKSLGYNTNYIPMWERKISKPSDSKSMELGSGVQHMEHLEREK